MSYQNYKVSLFKGVLLLAVKIVGICLVGVGLVEVL